MYMKKLFTLIVALMAGYGVMFGMNYCAESSWGYAGTNVTGGGNAKPTLVSTYTELRKALTTGTNQPKVIIIMQDIEFHEKITSKLSNLTLLALPGVRLITNESDPVYSGLLRFEGGRNIIIRNITFDGAGIYNKEGYDCLDIYGANHIWVDHCDFQDGMDGNFDIHDGADSITVSWCRFRYFGDPALSSMDHRYSNLIGRDNDDIPADGIFNVTLAFCWWDEGCLERMTRARHTEQHFLNCYWNSSASHYYIRSENSSSYIEGGTFEGKANEKNNIWESYESSVNSCTFVNCKGNIPADVSSVAAPDYPYDHLSPDEAKACVTNPSCGAGATLLVNTYGRVYAPCSMPRADAVFYWQMSGTSAPANSSVLPAYGGTVYVGSSKPDKSFVTEQASYASSVPDYMKAKDGQGLKNNANAEYLALKLKDGTFLAGDTLIICGYLPWKVSASLDSKDLIDSIQTGPAKTDYAIGQLILPIDADSLVLSRNRSLGTGISSILVCRKPCEKPQETPDTVLNSIMWDISDDDFKNLDTIKTDMAIRQLHLVASEDAPMVVDASKKSLDGYSFTHRLKTRNVGSTYSRHVWFDVKGDCTIDFYIASPSGSEEHKAHIAVGAYDNVAATVPAVAGSPAKQTYTYTGGVNRIYLYGADSGVNIYGIKLTYPGSESIDSRSATLSSVTNKILRNGQIFILRGDRVYTITGQEVR